jgi:hypothetical protein
MQQVQERSEYVARCIAQVRCVEHHSGGIRVRPQQALSQDTRHDQLGFPITAGANQGHALVNEGIL